MDIKTILFPTDFSDSSGRALDHALVLAHVFDARLIMLHVETPYTADPYNPKSEFPKLDELFQFIRDQVNARIEQPELPVMDGDIEVDHEVVRGISAADTILSFAKENDVSMIVMGTHGRTGLRHFLLGSTTEKVVHGARVPVLTIHHGEDLFIANEGTYKRILVPLDFSEASRTALKAGLEIAERFGSELKVTHVIEPVLTPQSLVTGDPSPARIDRDVLTRSRDALRDFAGELLPESTELMLRTGRPHSEIIDVVKETESDLLVIAEHGWSALERWLLGGTAERLIRKSPVPVFVVRGEKPA